jgi:hypothetical protein
VLAAWRCDPPVGGGAHRRPGSWLRVDETALDVVDCFVEPALQAVIPAGVVGSCGRPAERSLQRG